MYKAPKLPAIYEELFAIFVIDLDSNQRLLLSDDPL